MFVRYPGRTWEQALCSAASVNSPAPQSEQLALPRPEYLPAPQMSQAVWSAFVLVPGSHTLHVVLAGVSETSPTGHAVQESAPSEYVAGGQASSSMRRPFPSVLVWYPG